mgnify:CR=1 FL=1
MVRRPRVVGAGGVEESCEVGSGPLRGSDTEFLRFIHKKDAEQAQQEARWAGIRERWRTSPCDPKAWLESQENAPAAPVPVDDKESKDTLHKRTLAATLAKLESDPGDLKARAELNAMMRSKP